MVLKGGLHRVALLPALLGRLPEDTGKEKRLTITARRSHFLFVRQLALVHFPPEALKAQHPGSRTRTAFGIPLLLPVSFGKHRNRLRLFLLQPVV